MHPIHRAAVPIHGVVMRPFLGKPKLILLLSVMRSGTTLLTNILTDNNQISGFGEAHIKYRDASSLLALKYWILRFTKRYPRKGDYLFDKVLHNAHLPDLDFLEGASDVYPIFMVREPLSNAKSLQKLFQKENEDADLPWSYLENRYRQLDACVQFFANKNPIACLSYDALVKDPDRVLEGLDKHLSLSTPLSKDYRVPSYAGRWGIGDGSQNIRSGTIISEKAPEQATTSISVPASVSKAYSDLCSRLEEVSTFSRLK